MVIFYFTNKKELKDLGWDVCGIKKYLNTII